MKITLLTIVTLALVTCGNGQAQNNITETTVVQEPQSDKAGGTVKRGDKTATVSKCYWGNYRKAIEIREDPYRKVYADFNFAAEFETGTYTISTFANEHILEGGYTWGTLFIQGEGGSSVLKQGKLELTVTEDDYCKLKATGIDENGNEVTVTWEGPMTKDPTDY
ncbi:MAG: hypothetical protein J6X51_06720 [Bacteroidales bacterium]|nr:hypothetical protein [Bacteroidales bacterium]